MNRLIPEIAKISAYAQGSKVTVADVDAVAHHIPKPPVSMTVASTACSTVFLS